VSRRSRGGTSFKENAMLFISQWKMLPGNRDAAVPRFAKTGGQPPLGEDAGSLA